MKPWMTTKRGYMQYLSSELLGKIFLLLGIKQAAQLQCVCKSWRDLLKEKYFIQLYYKHCLFISIPTAIISINLTDILEEHHDCGVNVDHLPFKNPNQLVGSANGLFCTWRGFHLFPAFGLCSLFSPTTPEIVAEDVTWPPNLIEPCILGTHSGFGYHSQEHDFKILSAVKFVSKIDAPSEKIKWTFRVYSLKYDSWKEVVNHPFILGTDSYSYSFLHQYAEFAHDCLYWLVAKEEGVDKCVMRYDLHKEEFRLISLPDGAHGGISVWLTNLNGDIFVSTVKSKQEVGVGNVDDWDMDGWVFELESSKDVRLESNGYSWTRMYSCKPFDLLLNTYDLYKLSYRPATTITYLKQRREIVFLVDDRWGFRRLIWYNLDDQCIVRDVVMSESFDT